MFSTYRKLAGVVITLALGAVSGCSAEAGQAPPASPGGAASGWEATLPDVLARVEGEDITMEDVRARVGETLDQQETTYRAERAATIESAVQAIVRDRALRAEASEQGTTVQALIAAEAEGSLAVSDGEVAIWYAQNQARLGGRSLDQIRGQIVQLLGNQKRQAAQAALHERLAEERGVEIFLDKFRLTFDNTGSPSFGPEDAPITLVEYSDFECPFCGRIFPVLEQVKANYPDQVRLVFRQFPLTSLHPNAFKAAEASLCAQAQDNFWAMHDVLFAEQDRLTVRDLKEKASRISLDQGEFDQCLDTGRTVEQVQKDMAEGRRVGVTGTPALFLNGVAVEGGAVDYEVLEGLIEEELDRLGH